MKYDYIRKSYIASYIDGLLNEKHSNGYTYHSEELILNRFDAYCFEHNLNTVEISKKFLEEWMSIKDTESNVYLAKRISCVRQLLLYMASYGINVYIPHDFCNFKKALPHIFEPEEIKSFFKVLDSNFPNTERKSHCRLANEYRLIFRWYLCCGLRNSEAAGIRTENVDLNTGTLTILNSKGKKDRLVYLPSDLLESTRKYYSYLTKVLDGEQKWFFPGFDPIKPLHNSSVDRIFNKIWEETPYARCNNKPTVHDFRFTFVVSRMNLWAEEGQNLQVMMPYLSKYLGHKTTNETYYYYYLVKEAYNTVKKKDTIANDVIPEVNSYE